MSETVVVGDLLRWRECRDCGLFQRLPEIPDGEAAICARCDAMLRRKAKHSLMFARINASGAAILFVLALALPLVELHVLGRSSESNVFSGPGALRDHGLLALGIVVVATVVIMPAIKLAIELIVVFGVALTRTPRWLGWLFGWLEHVSPWAMIEVFLLGALVAYSRLEAMAAVDVGLAGVALCGTMLAIVAIDGTLDRESIWQTLEAKSPHLAPERLSMLPAPGVTADLIGCTECRRVEHAEEGDRCVRCHHHLAVRKGGLGRVWALLVGAALLYIPANVLPVMTVKRLGKGGPTTILHGVVELAQSHLWPLAALVLVASVIVPIFKLVSLVVMLVMTHRRSPKMLRGRTTLFRLVKFVGRWSMIDIFMLSVLVGVVRFGRIATVLPGMGAVAFCSVVILTMLATEMFDPRHMWDVGGRQEFAVERVGRSEVVNG
jgi:paraquat-inducible protein A